MARDPRFATEEPADDYDEDRLGREVDTAAEDEDERLVGSAFPDLGRIPCFGLRPQTATRRGREALAVQTFETARRERWGQMGVNMAEESRLPEQIALLRQDRHERERQQRVNEIEQRYGEAVEDRDAASVRGPGPIR